MKLAGLGLLLLCMIGPAALADDILKPEEAFRYTLDAAPGELRLHWDIEPGHYLYKKRMAYRSLTSGLVLADPVYPRGEMHDDEFFGPMEVYRGQALIRLPVASRAAGLRTARIEIRSQGCADIGLCYPPQTWQASVELPAARSGLTGLLGGGGGRSTDEPLPADQAFRPSIEILGPFRVAVDWVIEPGYYLYRDSLAITAHDGSVARTGPPLIPPGQAKHDEHFGDTEVFYDRVRIEVPLTRQTPAAGPLTLDLAWQGCKEDSICYPPGVFTLDTLLPAATDSPPPTGSGTAHPVSEQDRLSRLILNASLPLVIASFLGLGLLLSFTPCVLPMVPILSGIIAGQGKDVTTARAFALSLTYVLGMACTYTIAGAAFAAAGGQLQAALQKPWIIVAVAALFVALALSMFGLYELQMPAAIRNRVSGLGDRQRKGSFAGTAILGALSALVVTTCVAPPLVASLTVIAQAGDITRGALSLFAMSIGMGLPLLVIGTSAGRLLPKAGPWMGTVKGAFGFMMLGLAVWMLERILPAPLTVALWGVLVFVAGLFMGAFTTLAPQSGAAQKLGKGFGLLAALAGAVLLIGALGGATDPLRPLAGITSTGNAARHALEFRRVKTVAQLEQELADARRAGQPVMLDFYADWCVSCKEMERDTFTDEGVVAALAGVRLLQADVTANDEQDKALLKRFGIFGPPSIVFFSAAGQQLDDYRVVGFMPAEKFARHIDAALRGA